MKKVQRYSVFLILLTHLLFQPVFSQKKVHVLTRIIKKELKATDKKLVIKGEKATINVSSWDGNYFNIEIRLVSKNRDKKKAEKDLNILKYEVTESNSYYLLQNYFSSEKYSNVKSNLSAVYNIKVPKTTRLDITNIYGNVNLKNLTSLASLKNSFGEIHISNIAGDCSVRSYYSDVWVRDANLTFSCSADKSDIEMVNISGKISIKSSYGSLSFSAGSNLKQFNVDAKRTSIDFFTKSLNNYNYSLSTKYEALNIPSGWKQKIIKESNYTKLNLVNGKNHPLVEINTTYCQILIQRK